MSQPLAPLGPIFNANQVTLDQNPGTLPNMMSALLSWFQPITFGRVIKAVVNFNIVESTVPVVIFGIWEPISPNQQLEMNKDGQRKWDWHRLLATPQTSLQPDDILIREGIQYRVMKVISYTQYGYIEYNLINDYTDVGPTIET